MANFWLKLKVWTKTTVFAVLCIYLLIFIVKNVDKDAMFWWWFGAGEVHNTLVFAFVCFFSGVILTILVRTTLVTMRQVRALQARGKIDKAERIIQEQQAKASKLQMRPVASSTSGGAFDTSQPSTRTDKPSDE